MIQSNPSPLTRQNVLAGVKVGWKLVKSMGSKVHAFAGTRPSENEAVTHGKVAGTTSLTTWSIPSAVVEFPPQRHSDRRSDGQYRGGYRYCVPNRSGPDRAARPWRTWRDQSLWDDLHIALGDTHWPGLPVSVRG
jgi:hypothetical protein